MSRKKKILVGVGIYLAVTIIALAIISQTDSWKNANGSPQTTGSANIKNGISADAPLKERAEFYAKTNDKYDMKDLSVSVGVDGIITLRVLTDGLTDDHLVQRSCSYALDVGQAIFDNCAEVQRIQYLFDASFLDGLGNQSKQKAVSFALDRSVHSKMNYDNFENMVMADYNSMWNAAEELYIHPAIRKNLKKLK